MIWLIGAGGMSVDYVKVLQAQKQDFIVVGRGELSAKHFEDKTGHRVIVGGLVNYLSAFPLIPEAVIVSVGVEQLYNTTMQLLEYGVKHILVEKPGGLLLNEMEQLKDSAKANDAKVFIAYNRRFYSSVIKARELIELDGGVTSFNFELTEWSHVIGKLDKKPEVLAKWFLANSTHVADLAFFLGGKPTEITSYSSGTLDWHPTSSVFAGAGISDKGAIFNYGADWKSAGRWSVEMLTNKNRYVFRPMESLNIQARGSIKQNVLHVDDTLDKEFKPGLFLQVEQFINGNEVDLCSIEEQLSMFSVYNEMASYEL